MTLLCSLADLGDGQARGLQLDGLRVLIVRQGSDIFVYENRCPHRGIPLEWVPDQFLDASGTLLQCATHGALFLIDSGECVAGPCAGDSLRPLPWVLHEGSIWLQNAS